ncbi:hypothetical protein SHEWT2_00701 [Shewanella hafniensis]|nr:hypothetical protein [Shewanella putrefaciens]CAD6365523.1 hypothetical protein SHEWT2_00701 [Shewanella hafniensis]
MLKLAQVFAIDVGVYAVMSNHPHLSGVACRYRRDHK